MKILTLLELIQPKITTGRYSGTFRRNREEEDSPKFIGGGAFSNVKKNPKDPHTVIKNSVRPLDNNFRESDGYETYAKIVVRKKLFENPHFPRIYEAKKISDKAGKHINKYEIEALIPSESLSKEEVAAVCENFFSIHPDDQDVYTIVTVLSNAIRRGDYSEVKSEELKDACRILGQILRHFSKPGKSKLFLDMKNDNIMFRRGPTGLIPVFTDPFA